MAFSQYARFVQAALVDGAAGVVMAPGGRLSRAVRFTIKDGKIVEAEIIVTPSACAGLTLRFSTTDERQKG